MKTQRGWLTPDVVAKLGTVPDKELANTVGRSQPVVCNARNALGIPPCGKHPHKRRWSNAELGLLGTTADRALANRLGVSSAHVFQKRQEYGIPPYNDPPTATWPQKEVGLLGTIPDVDLAKRWKLSRERIRQLRVKYGIPLTIDTRGKRGHHNKREWSKAELGLLGTIPDREVAKRIGVCAVTVCKKRNSLNIPPCGHVSEIWNPKTLKLLGTMTDAELAKRLGCSKLTVFLTRKKLGIPAKYNNWKGRGR